MRLKKELLLNRLKEQREYQNKSQKFELVEKYTRKVYNFVYKNVKYEYVISYVDGSIDDSVFRSIDGTEIDLDLYEELVDLVEELV